MSEVKVDTISERTAAGGVTIDGVLVKDGVATFQTAAGSPLVFEGATADAFETTFAITDPTADRTITFPDSSFTVPTSGGTIQQVVQLYKTDTETQAGGGAGTFYDISGYTLAITPIKAGSKILVDINPVIGNTYYGGAVDVQGDIDGAGYAAIGAPDTAGSRTKSWIGSTYIGADGTRCQSFSQKFLWSPSYSLTDVLTVKCRWSATSLSTIMLNRSYTGTDTDGYFVATSSITLWEIN